MSRSVHLERLISACALLSALLRLDLLLRLART
jgi:hypothetical protein